MYLKLKILFLCVFHIRLITKAELPYRKLISPRIYGGQVKTIEQLGGYAAQIYLDNMLVCTGTLLSARHILTSAHCFEQARYDNYHVLAGVTEQMQYFYSENIKNKVLKLKIHPKYDKKKFIADIAVLAVSTPIMKSNVGYLPICTTNPKPGNMVTVSGWGNSEYMEYYNPLRSIEVPLITTTECNQKMERKMPDNVICAAGYNKRTICSGDSGGPLVLNGELCGVATWTWECGNNDMPDVYISVYYYRNFIQKTMKEMGD